MDQHKKLNKLTLASMFAALAFICFAYLRIEIPMGGGMTGKIYIGHTFIILSSLLLGTKYGGFTGAVGLSLADILSGYLLSAPPTFIAKFLIGLAASAMAHQILHLSHTESTKKLYLLSGLAGAFACFVNIVSEPIIRYAFKVYIMGYPEPIAYLSALNCAISMAVSAIPCVIFASFLYVTFHKKVINAWHAA